MVVLLSSVCFTNSKILAIRSFNACFWRGYYGHSGSIHNMRWSEWSFQQLPPMSPPIAAHRQLTTGQNQTYTAVNYMIVPKTTKPYAASYIYSKVSFQFAKIFRSYCNLCSLSKIVGIQLSHRVWIQFILYTSSLRNVEFHCIWETYGNMHVEHFFGILSPRAECHRGFFSNPIIY